MKVTVAKVMVFMKRNYQSQVKLCTFSLREHLAISKCADSVCIYSGFVNSGYLFLNRK